MGYFPSFISRRRSRDPNQCRPENPVLRTKIWGNQHNSGDIFTTKSADAGRNRPAIDSNRSGAAQMPTFKDRNTLPSCDGSNRAKVENRAAQAARRRCRRLRLRFCRMNPMRCRLAGQQPRAQRLVAPDMLQPLQHRRDVVPRLRVDLSLVDRHLTDLELPFLDFSHGVNTAKIRANGSKNRALRLQEYHITCNLRHSKYAQHLLHQSVMGFLADTNYACSRDRWRQMMLTATGPNQLAKSFASWLSCHGPLHSARTRCSTSSRYGRTGPPNSCPPGPAWTAAIGSPATTMPVSEGLPDARQRICLFRIRRNCGSQLEHQRRQHPAPPLLSTSSSTPFFRLSGRSGIPRLPHDIPPIAESR